MEETSILSLMINHHILIETDFNFFIEDFKKKNPNATKSLANIKWEIEKHFFVEEKAIFNFLPKDSFKFSKVVNQLKEEHISMLKMLENFSGNLAEITNYQVEIFYNLLESHRKIEEEDLYRRLDKELSVDQKKKIIFMISQIPIKK